MKYPYYQSILGWILVLNFFYFQSFALENNPQFSRLTVDQGLSHNQVNSILKDPDGFMWFGTPSGLNKFDGVHFKIFKHSDLDSTSLDDDYIVGISEGPNHCLWIQTRKGINIYDPRTERFSHKSQAYLKSISIPEGILTLLKKDRFGTFWFVHPQFGVFRYIQGQKTAFHIPLNNPLRLKPDSLISDLSTDSKGNLWIIYTNGDLIELDSKMNKTVFNKSLISKNQFKSNFSFKIFLDNHDDLWAFVFTYPSGVYFLNETKTVFKHLVKGNGQGNLNTDIISDLLQAPDGKIWIATDHGGLNILDKNDFHIKIIKNREDDIKTLGQNSLISLYRDNTGIIWIGTYRQGISYFHENIQKFPLFTHHLSDPNSLPYNDINCFAEDRKGNLWIGTNGGGLIYFNRENGTFKSFLHDPGDPSSLSNNVIVCLYIDHNQKLWIGTYFGGLECFDGHSFVHYRHDNKIPGSIAEDRVWSILEDSDHTLWVGTLSGGLNRFNRQTQSFTHFTLGQPNSVHSNYISALMEDRKKNLWIITSYGVDILEKSSNQFIHFLHQDKNPNSLINDYTNSVFQDSRGLIWISTREGISVFNPETNTFQNIHKEDGLPDNTILDIQEDNFHHIWVSTTNGITNIELKSSNNKLLFNFNHYNEKDGLQGKIFNINASCRTRNGEMVFGGINGFNIFKPTYSSKTLSLPNLVFTDFQVLNERIKPGEKLNGHIILPQSITQTKNLELRYGENVFALEFESLDYFNPDKIKIFYRMVGFDKDWILSDKTIHKAIYTNLDAGDYTFQVKAVNSEGIEKEIKLLVTIKPPFWKSFWAYGIYGFLFFFGLYWMRKKGIEKLKTEFELEKERGEAKQRHELDLMKIKFFTNVSHEFRTPLSLIMAPIQKVLTNSTDVETRSQMEFAGKNARRLLNLVNQLLDFRKMEFQELKLNPSPGDIIDFIHDIGQSFNDIGEQKKISFAFESEIEGLYCEFDHDKIERILFNLLSNAYKFTPSGGHISLLIQTLPAKQVDYSLLEIRVIDTGIGIPKEKIEKIFDPFFQNEVPGSMINEGSGIGLSITKEFIKLHGGNIRAESEDNEGTCFIWELPLKEVDLSHSIPCLKKEISRVDLGKTKSEPILPSYGKKPKILIVEDNADFRFYIKDNLKTHFQILEASDGKEGWQKTLSYHPNLVVSDILMPEMTGTELCIKIKNDNRTSHIPVLLLTAITGEDQQIKGLETGANDYMTKPFNFEILQSKIKNLLNQQESMRKTFQKQVEVKPSIEWIDSPDETFLQKALKHIEDNISNQNFSVEELSESLFMSRYTLYKKILALTGKTPNEFIRYIRLKRAAQLLESGYLTVSQISYKVGFKSQKYFVKTFKNEFSVSPSNYLQKVME